VTRRLINDSGHDAEEVTVTILCEPDAQLAAVLAAFIGDGVRTVDDLASAAAALDAAPSETLLVIGAGVDLNATLQFASACIRMSPAPR